MSIHVWSVPDDYNIQIHQNVASPVPAERQLMKTMLGELREFKERIVRDASQYDKLYHFISLLSS